MQLSVDISGTIALVGGMRDAPGGINDAGSAYIFDATSGTLLATLSNPDQTISDFFGWRVGLDGNTAIVGAYNNDPGAIEDAGTVYVYTTALVDRI